MGRQLFTSLHHLFNIIKQVWKYQHIIMPWCTWRHTDDTVVCSVCNRDSGSPRAIQALKHTQISIKQCFLDLIFEIKLGFWVTVWFAYLDGSFERCGYLQRQPCLQWISLQLESFSCHKLIAKDDSRTQQNEAWSYKATQLAWQHSDWLSYFCQQSCPLHC